MRVTYIALGSLLLAAVTGCGDDPVSYSAPVALNLKIQSGDVDQGVASDDKGINTESGNPWGAFVADAQAELGADPGDIDLDEITVLLGATSTNVTELREIFDGTVDVQFEMNDSDNIYPVATTVIDDDLEGRESGFDVSFDYAEFTGDDLTRLLGGAFKVVIAGPADPAYEAADGDADLQLTLRFSAYE
jgi:hypothetical protein